MAPRRPETYAERTHASPYWIVRFPHARRHSQMIKLVARLQPATILDYGAGSGHFLIELFEAQVIPRSGAVAYEPIASEEMGSISENLLNAGLADVVEVARDTDGLVGPFDLIACMGVLEHLTASERRKFYDVVERVLAPSGTVAIDVPVEVGPAILVKNAARRILKKDQRQYRLAELLRIAFGGLVFDPLRFDPSPSQNFIVFHQGFDHRLLRAELANRFKMVGQYKTPLNWLPTLCNQEVVLLATRR